MAYYRSRRKHRKIQRGANAPSRMNRVKQLLTRKSNKFNKLNLAKNLVPVSIQEVGFEMPQRAQISKQTPQFVTGASPAPIFQQNVITVAPQTAERIAVSQVRQPQLQPQIISPTSQNSELVEVCLRVPAKEVDSIIGKYSPTRGSKVLPGQYTAPVQAITKTFRRASSRRRRQSRRN